jgi:hypothetical protein
MSITISPYNGGAAKVGDPFAYVFTAQAEEPSGSTGDVTLTNERIVYAVRQQPDKETARRLPLGVPQWKQPLDPADHVPYGLDFGQLMDPSETIATIETVSIDADDTLGLIIDMDAPYHPIIDSAKSVLIQAWFSVEEGRRKDASWSGKGQVMSITFRITTNSTPPKRYERTAALNVRQQ